MTTVRQQIFNYLKKHQLASAADIARDLRMTPANARHHLSLLQGDGRVEQMGERREGRGRPLKLYGLSRATLGDNLDQLAEGLLAEWLDGLPENQKEARLKRLALRLRGEAGEDLGNAPVLRRLAGTVARLNQLGYQARWEAHADGPRVILGYCPYAAIIAKHPELCRMDAALLESQLSTKVEQSAKLVQGAGGWPYCAFLLEGR
jgi:predicted ArsR family transcriptional regulator